MFAYRSKALFFSAILGVGYTIFLFSLYRGAVGGSIGVGHDGAAIAAAMIIPLMVLMILAILFNLVAFFFNSKGFAIAAGALYSACAVVFIPHFFYVIPMIVLSMVGVAMVSKINKNAKVAVSRIAMQYQFIGGYGRSEDAA